jgi:PAS domain S-box-containing protein
VLSTAYKNIGTIEFCNEEVVNLVGYTSKELLNKDINMIIPKDIAKVHRELML